MLVVSNNKIILLSISLFIVVFYLVQLGKPKWLYNANGSLRVFGIGYKNKTIFPIWLMTICLAIICYLTVLFYVYFSK